MAPFTMFVHCVTAEKKKQIKGFIIKVVKCAHKIVYVYSADRKRNNYIKTSSRFMYHMVLCKANWMPLNRILCHVNCISLCRWLKRAALLKRFSDVISVAFNLAGNMRENYNERVYFTQNTVFDV